MRWARAALPVFTLLLALGCTTTRDSAPPSTQWADYQDHARSLTSWDLSAKVALRWPGGAESAKLDWSQRRDRSQLELSGPLGAGAMRITREGDRLQVARGGERRMYDSSTPDMLAAATGWPIPVNALPFWLRGLPDPSQPIDHLALANGRAQEIHQGGWIVSYSDYAPAGDGYLPMTLHLSLPADAISLRLVKGRWSTESP